MDLQGYKGPSFPGGGARQGESPIHNLLEEGELILWEGQPDPKAHFVDHDIFLVPFSLLWGAFMIAFMGLVLYSVIQNPDVATGLLLLLIGIPLMGIPTVMMGLYFALGRFWVKADRKKKTRYAVTNRRAIIHSSFFGERAWEARLEDIGDITRINGAFGGNSLTFVIPKESGDLSFWNPFPANAMDMNNGLDIFPGAEGKGELVFLDIDNIEQVYSIAREAVGQAKTSS